MRGAIVTGASKGIGRSIACALAARNYRVLAVARSSDLLAELAASSGGAIKAHSVDLRDETAASDAVAAAIGEFGRLDLVVHSAGAAKRGDFFQMSRGDFLDGFATKFHGAVELTRAAWPHLVNSGEGHLLSVVGAGGRTPSADFTIGGPVNSALINFTKAMAERGRRDGVRVNAINPGLIETDRLKMRIANLAEEKGVDMNRARAMLIAAREIRRFGRPEEIAALAVFLDTPEAAYIHGAIIDCDGGLTKGI